MDPQLDSVVAETNRNREQFEAFCRSLSPAQLVAPIPESHWRVKDYIAHLATIDIYVGEWFEHLADGRAWRPTLDDGSPFDIDRWNDVQIEARRDATVEELLREAAGHRERLWAAVDRFTPEVLAQEFTFRDRRITYLRYLQLWTAHDPAHAKDMVRGLPGLADDAALQEWFARYRL